MAGKWPYKRVEEIALKVAMGPFGSSIKVETFTDTGIPIISGQHLREAELTDSEFNFIAEEHADSLKNANVQRGDVIFTHAGNIGQVAFIPNDSKYQRYVISQRQFYLRCDTSRIIPEFIAYYFKSPEGQHKLLANANQVGVPSIARPSSYLKTIEVPVPSIEEQQIVVRNIKALDAKIRANRRINQTLEAMAQAIFKSWFVDFDPVKAKIAAIAQGEDPLRAAMRAISGKTDAELDQMPCEHYDPLAATAALFPDEMEESELGEIPSGWKISTIGEMVEIAGGATPDTKNESYWNPPEHFWTSPKDLSGAQSPVLLTTERKISAAGLSRIGSGLLPKGTLLMSSRAPIGYLAITQIPVAINQGYIAMLPGGKLPPLYLLMWCQQNMEEIKGQANGSTFMEISKKAFRPMPAINPGSIILDRFIESVIPLFGRVVEGVKESSQLAQLRDTLLPKLLSGELSVENIPVEAAH